MSRVRVLHIVAGLDIGHTFGGAERSGLELARALDRDHFDASVCAFWRCDTRAEAEWQAASQAEGIPVIFATPSGARRDSTDFFAGARRIAAWCRTNPVHIVHAHHEGGALAGAWTSLRGGATAVVRTTHVPLTEEWGHGTIAPWFRKVFSRALFPLALDAEVGVSPEFQRQLAVRALNRREPELIYNTRRLEARSPRLRMLPIIGSVGRLVGQKGHNCLIEAMPRVRAAVPDARVMIVGDGELRTQLERHAAGLGLTDVVTFLGQRDDVPALLDQMAVLAMPSMWEGVSTAFLEGVAAGVPVVAADIPGFREFIQHRRSGWLVPARDPSQLADALIEVLTHSDLALGCARRAQQEVLPMFSMRTIAEQYAALYRRCLQRKRYGRVGRP